MPCNCSNQMGRTDAAGPSCPHTVLYTLQVYISIFKHGTHKVMISQNSTMSQCKNIISSYEITRTMWQRHSVTSPCFFLIWQLYIPIGHILILKRKKTQVVNTSILLTKFIRSQAFVPSIVYLACQISYWSFLKCKNNYFSMKWHDQCKEVV